MSRYEWGEPIGEYNGKPIYGGDCWNGMAAVYMTGPESTGGRYPNTEEEWELFGAHLPDPVTVLKDVMIGCKEYQALRASGVTVKECLACPFMRDKF